MSQAEQLISDSIARNATTRAAWDCFTAYDLVVHSVAHRDGHDARDFWGADDSGNQWHVQLVARPHCITPAPEAREE